MIFSLVSLICVVTASRHRLFRPQSRTQVARASRPLPNAATSASKRSDHEAASFRSFLGDFLDDVSTVYGVPSGVATIVKLDGCQNVSRCVPTVECVAVGHNVDCDTSLFRIASISKSFTCTALLQLVDQKQVDLNQCIEEVLPDDLSFDGPSAFFTGPGGVTPHEAATQPCIPVHRLLTHSAGLDETWTGSTALSLDDVIPLHEFLRRAKPLRVSPVGASISYSNYALALVGFIIQHVSGMSYEEYIRTNILDVIGMNNTAVGPRDTVFRDWYEHLAPSGLMDPDDFPFSTSSYYINDVPAGSIASTGTDMAAYAATHLRYGLAPNGRRVLSEESSRLMQAAQVGAPLGLGYGFYTEYLANLTVVQHDGDLPTFASRLFLAHSENLAVFMSFGLGGVPARNQFSCLFAQKFFSNASTAAPLVLPVPKTVSASAGYPVDSASDLTGQFFNTRVPRADCWALGARLQDVFYNTKMAPTPGTAKGHTLSMSLSAVSPLSWFVPEWVAAAVAASHVATFDWAPSVPAWWQSGEQSTDSGNDTPAGHNLDCTFESSVFPYLYQGQNRGSSTAVRYLTVSGPYNGLERSDGGFQSGVLLVSLIVSLSATLIVGVAALWCSALVRAVALPLWRRRGATSSSSYASLLETDEDADDAGDSLKAPDDEDSGEAFLTFDQPTRRQVWLRRVASLCTEERPSFVFASVVLAPLMLVANVGFLLAWTSVSLDLAVSYSAAATRTLYLPIVGLVTALVSTLLSLSTCFRRHWHVEQRIAFALMCVASFVFTHFFNKVNLLGMHCWNGQ